MVNDKSLYDGAYKISKVISSDSRMSEILDAVMKNGYLAHKILKAEICDRDLKNSKRV